MWKKIIHITINHAALGTFKKGILNELNALNRKWMLLDRMEMKKFERRFKFESER